MDTKRVCSVCGKPLAPGAPEGLCPECLLKAGLGTGVDIEADTGGKSPRFTPPKIEELAAKFPQLEVLEFIGQGGMGAVYKARQKQLDRVVALKILPPQAGGAAFAERFTREARALAKLNHPHIVTLYEFGQSDGLFYFLMEFVDGVNLRQLLSNSRISPREALAIVPQICEALQFAHDSGIVHRDIKPENVLLDKKGLVKIADFGVAKMIAESLTQAAGKSTAATGELTEAGSTLGTPQYMAPEQIKNSAEVDHRADIYSLGVVFYQMLTGELPSGKIEPPSRKVQIDVRLDEVVLRALEKKPEMRFQQASDIKTVVETIATTPQPPAPEAPAGFKRYKDFTWNFELDIPEGWNKYAPVHTNSPSELLRFASHENARLILYRMPHDPAKSLNDISDARQKVLVKAGYGNFLTGETTVNGKRVLRLDFDRGEGEGIWSCREYIMAEGTLAYALGFGATNKAAMFETFDCMAKSFRFQAAPQTAQGFRRYKNPEWNFELDIPAGWNTFPPVLSNSIHETLRFASHENGRHLLIIFRAVYAAKSLKVMSDLAQKVLAKAGFGNFVSTETTIGGKPAWTLDFDRPEGDGTWSCRHYFIAEGMQAYTLGFGTTDKAAMFEIFDRMAKSFQFEGPNFESSIHPFSQKAKPRPFLPKTETVPADEPKSEPGSKKAQVEPLLEGYTVRIEPVNPERARRFGTGAVFASLAIVLVMLIAAMAILFSVHKASVNANLRAASHVNVLFHVRVFEADAGFVDQLIPASERQSGVQPNVKSFYAQGVRETSTFSQGNFHMINHDAETESQFAPVSPAVVHALLKGIAAYPGVLVDETNLVSGIWWQLSSIVGLPVSWGYSVAKNSLFGNGTGSASYGVRKENGVTEVRIDGELRHSINILLSDRSYTLPDAKNARFLYEGPLPQTNELVFLVPFLRNDGSQHYLVTVFDFNGENSEEIPSVALSGPPFTAQLHQATVELAAVGDYPWTNPVCWYPNGQPSPKAFPTGQQNMWSPDDTNLKKIVFYVRNQSTNGVSMPICRVDESWPLNVSSSWLPPYEFNHKGYLGLSLGVPTNATMANLSIGVANEPWETVISMDHPVNGADGEGTGENNWSGTYRSVTGANGDVAVACTYTTRSNWISRMVYVNGNGKIVPIDERSCTDDNSNPATGTLLISSNEFTHIKQFLVQRRKCQWMEFDNISLQQGHLTSVTAKVY